MIKKRFSHPGFAFVVQSIDANKNLIDSKTNFLSLNFLHRFRRTLDAYTSAFVDMKIEKKNIFILQTVPCATDLD